jgi:hypothetical protein
MSAGQHPDPRRAIAELLRETGHAHHQAFIHVNGEDPEWPAWYASYLVGRLGALLRTPLEESALAAQLAEVEEERAAKAPGADWPAYYADWFLRRYAQ